MNEDQTKHIVKESLLKTSDSFTDALMQKIEQQPVEVKVSTQPLIFLCVLALFFIFSLAYLIGEGVPELKILDLQFKIPALLLQIMGSFFILYIFSQILNIYKNILQFKQLKIS